MNETSTASTWQHQLRNKHEQLMHYAASLQDDDFLFCESGRWNAGQQLEHVYLCLKTISGALASKGYIEQTFGRIDRPLRSYDEVIGLYKNGLAEGGKSPERFVPGSFAPEQKAELFRKLQDLLQLLETQLNSYTDEDLDSLILPHPFVGKLTIRELMYLMTEHASVHQASIGRALRERAGS